MANPYAKGYSEVPPASRFESPGWVSSRPRVLLPHEGIGTRGAIKGVEKQVAEYNAAADAAVKRINDEADAREAARRAQAVADSRFCGAAGCVRRVGESLFGKKKTAGRRRRYRNKKGGKKTLKRRSRR